MKNFRLLFVIVAFVLIVSLACTFGRGNTQQTPQNQPTPKQLATKQPTARQPSTKQSTTKKTPTKQPTNEAQATATIQGTGSATDTPDAQNLAVDFFTDTFDTNSMDNYSVENRRKGSDEDKMKVNIQDGAMVFGLQANNLWVNVTYKPFKYTDVKISIKADNRGKENNNVTLFCRQSSEGWYEFSIANSGSYWIYAYDATGAIAEKGYNTIFTDSSKGIKHGKDSNEYEASCVGDKLTLSINGTEVKTVRDARYKFREGTVGFGVSSFSAIPILVNVDEFTVGQP